MLSFSVTGSSSELDGLITRLTPAALQVPVTAAAEAIRDRYYETAPRDTGSMAFSAYVHPALGETNAPYQEGAGLARDVNPRAVLLPELPAPEAPGAVVGVAAAHAVFQEYGTSRQPARPTFTPAVEEERARFPARVAAAVWGNG